MRLTNLDLDVLGGVVKRGRTDASVFRLHKRVEGRWSFTAGGPAYTASVSHGKDTTDLYVDIAPGFGGQGLAPYPLQYLLAGLGACYASTLVTIAATEGAALCTSVQTSTTPPPPAGRTPHAPSAPSSTRSSTPSP